MGISALTLKAGGKILFASNPYLEHCSKAFISSLTRGFCIKLRLMELVGTWQCGFLTGCIIASKGFRLLSVFERLGSNQSHCYFQFKRLRLRSW